MKLSSVVIQTPRLVILASLIFMILGAVAVVQLPKERTPRIRLPVIVVAVPNIGAQPAINESDIIDVIEDEAGELDDLRDNGAILGQAVDGAALIQFVFADDVRVEDAKRDVESLVNRVKGQFPKDAQQDPGPIINDIAFEDWPIIQVFVSGGADGRQRRRIAENLEKQIKELPGIAGVDLFGGLEREIQIELNPHVMDLYDLAYEDIAAAVQRAIQEAPSGAVEQQGGADRRVRAPARFQSLDEIEQLRIPRPGQQGDVQLSDVANVSMGHKPRTSIARYGGADAVVLLVQPKTDIDVMGTADRVQQVVDQFVNDGRGEDAYIGTVRSQAREIRYMLEQLGSSALYGTVLVMVLLWAFLGWRNAAMIGLAVPFAILGSAAIMWVAKVTIAPDVAINNMTLFATILVVGMVVDGCIIVGENIYRHRQLGHAPLPAAQRGVHEVGGSLIGAYLTTFAAFGPMFLVRGVMGDFMQLLPIVVFFALCSAALVDHFLLPVLSIYCMKVKKPVANAAADHGDDTQAANPQAQHEDLSAEQAEIKNAEAFVQSSRVAKIYGRAIKYALHHRLLMLGLSTVTASLPVFLYVVGAIPLEFFPDGDVPVIEVVFEAPMGSSMEKRTAAVAAEIEDAVNKAVRPEEWYKPSPDAPRAKPVTTIGETDALTINLQAARGFGPEFGMVYVELELAENRQRSAEQIRKAIADAIPPLPAGYVVRVTTPEEGPPGGAPVLVRLRGREQTSYERLAQRAAEVKRILQAVPGVYDVTMDYRLRPQWEVSPRRELAETLYGVSADQVTRAVNFALQGVQVGDADFGGVDEIDIRMRHAPEFRDEAADLEALPMRGRDGSRPTLGEVAQIREDAKANIIRHYDRDRVVNVTAELNDGVNIDTVKQRVIEALNPGLSPAQAAAMARDTQRRTVYSDYEMAMEFGGELEIRDDAIEDLTLAMGVAFAAMLIILVVKFNSFVQPLIVLFSVPLSLVGVFLGLLICGFSFSVSAMIGVVALAGIVVNDAIVLVDFINRLRQSNVPLEQAVIYAGQLRIRPIILTTVTTIGGLIPLSLNISGGGEFWQPLTITIMFGLGFATLLQLFIIPLACYTFDKKRGQSILDPAGHEKLAGLSEAQARLAAVDLS